MVMPASGAITMSALRTEFEGPTPCKLSDLYRGGNYVPNTAANSGIPTSGEISFSDFYNADGTPIIQLSDTLIAGSIPNGLAFAGYFVQSDGKVYKDTNTGGTSYFEDWCQPVGRAPSNYQLHCSVNSTLYMTGNSFNTWLALTSTRGWTLEPPQDGNLYIRTLTLQIRKGTGAVIDTATITLRATSGDGSIGI